MNKDKIIRNYTAFSVLMGVFFFLAMFLYVNNYTGLINGLVDKTIFTVTINNYIGNQEISNLPLYIFLLITVFNIVIYVAIGRSKEITKQPLKEVTLLNLILSFILVFGQLVFVYLIPEAINGEVMDQFIMVDMPKTVFASVKVININYLVSLLYIGYNIYVLVKTKEDAPEKDDFDQELYEDTLIREFTKED